MPSETDMSKLSTSSLQTCVRRTTTLPLDKIETGYAILAADGIEVVVEDRDADARATRTRRSNIATPLVRLRIVSGNCRNKNLFKADVDGYDLSGDNSSRNDF